MALDPYSSLVVVGLVFIWIITGVMLWKAFRPHKTTQLRNQSPPRGQVDTIVVYSPARGVVSMRAAHEEVSSKGVDGFSSSNTLLTTDIPDVTITVDPPTCGDTKDLRSCKTSGSSDISDSSSGSWSEHSSVPASVDSSCGGFPNLTLNGATGGRSSSTGSSSGSQSDISGFHSLHSNDQPHGRTLSGESSGSSNEYYSWLSSFHSLHSNDQPQRRTLTAAVQRNSHGAQSDVSGFNSLHSNDQPQKSTPSGDSVRTGDSMSQPCTLASTEDAPIANNLKAIPSGDSVRTGDSRSSHSNIMSQPGTLASTEGAPHDDDSGMNGDSQSSSSDVMSQPGTLASTEVVPNGDNTSQATTSGNSSRTSDSNFAGSDVVSQPRTLASTEDALQDDNVSQATSGDSLNTSDSKSSGSGTMSQPGTLASTEGAPYDDSKANPGADALRTGDCNSSNTDVISQPGTLVSTDDAPQGHNASQVSHYLQVGRPVSDGDGSSTISSIHSLRSTESPRRRPLLGDVSPSLPAMTNSTSENALEDIVSNKRTRWLSL